MFPLARTVPQFRSALVQSRQMTVVSGPPTVRISLPEKIAHGVAIVVGMSAVPAWVLVNIKNYRARD